MLSIGARFQPFFSLFFTPPPTLLVVAETFSVAGNSFAPDEGIW